jgi:hypothetical protein
MQEPNIFVISIVLCFKFNWLDRIKANGSDP